MSTAPKSLLELIHEQLAKDMLELLQSGNAEAKDWAVIVKFLKDNSIGTLVEPGDGAESAMAKLMAKAQESIGKFQ